MQKWTSLTAATNLAAHLIGPGGSIVWLGVDGKAAADGRAWHHKPHRWPAKAARYDRHRGDLATMVEPLRTTGITLWNASPGSAYADLWPVIDLQDVLMSVAQRKPISSGGCGLGDNIYSRSFVRAAARYEVWLETHGLSFTTILISSCSGHESCARNRKYRAAVDRSLVGPVPQRQLQVAR
jgi:hypothetical protein